MENYAGKIAGGRGINAWTKDFKVKARNMLKAVEKVYLKLPFNADIVEITQID